MSAFRSRSLTCPIVVLAAAALIAAGCGGARSSGASTASGDGGPLGWLPEQTWSLTSVDLGVEQIDRGVETLDRLPAWSLAEGFLPASDGRGLRRELLEQLASGDGGSVSPKRLEAAFGDVAGIAVTDTDFDLGDRDGGDDAPPLLVWIEVDDEDAAQAALEDVTDGEVREGSHRGIDYRHAKDGPDTAAWLIEDGLLVGAPGVRELERAIDAHEGTSVADDETAVRVLDAAGFGTQLLTSATASDPLLEGFDELASSASREQGSLSDADLERIGAALRTEGVDDLIPDWTASSFTIDDSGVRVRGTWSNPRELPDVDTDARELSERMPALAIVGGGASDGSELRRVQAAWSDVKEAADIDVDELRERCPAARGWACDLGIELAEAALEDESLAEALEDAGPSTGAYVQDVAALAASGAAVANAGNAVPAPRARTIEAVSTQTEPLDWTRPASLAQAMTAAGLVVTTTPDGLGATIRIVPASPLGRELAQVATDEVRTAWLAAGFDYAALTGRGITISGEVVDDLLVSGYPQSAPSRVEAALAGDGDTLGDHEGYRDAVTGAKPPERVGQYGYLDLAALVVGALEAVDGQEGSPELSRLIPTVRNNLAAVPGILAWTSREEVDGESVGVFEMVLVIEE